MNELSSIQKSKQERIAVTIPCYNEEVAIGKVIKDFKAALPNATIYVYDNNSTDRTAEIALNSGAIVRKEPTQGKGAVVRRMFADIDADVYVLVDGDSTYDANDAPIFVAALIDGSLDMVNGLRVANTSGAYRSGHKFGNALLSGIVRLIFGDRIKDMLSGYKVVSRRYAKSFPALSTGFEIETELTVHALELNMPILEIPTRYGERSEESPSKLRTVRDGLRILQTIVRLVRIERPLEFFSIIAFILASISVILSIPLTITYLETGLVPRFPTAILSTGLMILAFNAFFSGLILDTVTRGRQEMKRMQYLAVSATKVRHEA